MFWHLILVLLSPLYLMFALVFRSDQARLVVALYQQVLVLQRQLGKQPSLVKGERLALVLSGLLLARKRLGDALLIVKPETLVRWHRAIVRRHWRLLSRRKPGRPPEITPEMEQLVLRIARENSWMGYGKIAGEMRKLGFARFGRTSVKRILNQHGLTPETRRGRGLGWLQFFSHYGQFIWASDFCTVTTATLRTYYVVFFLDRLPVRSPDLNGYAERWIRSLRQECLDRVIILNEAHLCWVLREYVRYYNERRPHQSLGHLPPEALDTYPCEGKIVARPVLGGLINDYCRLAA